MYNLFRRRTASSRCGRNWPRGRVASLELLESRTLLSTISGKSFNDPNANGVLDPGEAGVAGREIFIDVDRDGALSPGDVSKTTDASGNYRFEGLSLGGYLLREVPKDGFIPTSPPTGSLSVFLLSNNTDATNRNFGSRQDLTGTAQVTGVVYEDLDENGLKDPNELGLANFPVYADLNSSGHFDEGEPRALSDASGQYQLTLKVGNLYQIREDVPAGWRVSQPADQFYFAPIFTEIAISGRNFGNVRSNDPGTGSSAISGVVFDDLNNNGVNDSEPGIQGRTVYIDGNDNGSLDQGESFTQTGDDGSYSLSVDAGTYVVRTVVPSGFDLKAPASGFYQVIIGQDQDLGGFDFGTRAQSGLTISGAVYRDLANLGTRDPGEDGLPSIQVYLDLNSSGGPDPGEPTASSAADGTYAITASLQPGFYLLRTVSPPGVITTPPLYLLSITTANLNSPIPGRDFGIFQFGGAASSSAFMVTQTETAIDPIDPISVVDISDAPALPVEGGDRPKVVADGPVDASEPAVVDEAPDGSTTDHPESAGHRLRPLDR